ncbi:hypothetical protein BT96DRAFT_935693 [Gymnopus androsaceus JB14]|uniref:DUF1308 domain-containing protein n=1 Tax=Gymnopus androsaceus JB14 TaxID=1447944 RepID=A0A6A4I685_9AGAR|nr:hypothetical protein BT96DRAFT_935693 [Gymnopus androsaceus JB14]
MSESHPDLRNLRIHLRSIHDSITHFQPPAKKPPILDSSLEVAEDTHWLQYDNIPGLKKLKESIKIDLDVLDKFLDDPESANLQPLSTNAPYLIAVWNEVLCAQAPVICVFKSFPMTAEDVSNAANNEARKRSSAAAPQAPRIQGTKIDVVADCGRQWIRLNTIKNSRILAEFREIDSYLTDDESSDEEDENYRPSLAQKEFDNSILRMGRSLVAAAKVNPLQLPIPHSQEIIPRITMRLTRLDPDADPNEPRIMQTIQGLIDMGIDVQLGERTEDEIPLVKPNTAPHPSSLLFEPTTKINVDLSVLIALVSDLTHSPLPTSIDEANTRFIPPERYTEWKKKVNANKAKAKKLIDPDFNDEDFEISLPAQQDMAKTSRALTNQVLQEMGKGLLQDMFDRLDALDVPLEKIEFWTTQEARDRCLRIVSKVGGSKEKRRAQALLFDLRSAPNEQQSTVEPDQDADFPFPPPDTLEKAEEVYWEGSRYAHKLLPLLPLHFYPTSTSLLSAGPSTGSSSESDSAPSQISFPSMQDLPRFFQSLNSTCSDILEYEKHSRSKGGPRALKGNFGLGPNGFGSSSNSNPNPIDDADETELNTTANPHSSLPRATVTKANPRLTAHTVQSLQWGSRLGWTTLTANRTSVKAIVKEINARAKVEMFEDAFGVGVNGIVNGVSSSSSAMTPTPTAGDVSVSDEATANLRAAIWIIDPRSLAEGMRADSVDVDDY